MPTDSHPRNTPAQNDTHHAFMRLCQVLQPYPHIPMQSQHQKQPSKNSVRSSVRVVAVVVVVMVVVAVVVAVAVNLVVVVSTCTATRRRHTQRGAWREP
eukprot:122599-Chlamydomonas_euryale.AAC.2